MLGAGGGARLGARGAGLEQGRDWGVRGKERMPPSGDPEPGEDGLRLGCREGLGGQRPP